MQMQYTRREFVRRSIQATMVAGASWVLPRSKVAASARASEEAPLLPIVDTHQHLWDVQRLRPPWLDGAAEVLRRSYVTKDYLEATRGLNVVKAVYMEIDVDPRRHVEEAEQVVALCRSGTHPTVAAVISGRPASSDFRPHILRFKGNPYIKGVRQVLHRTDTPPGLCLQEAFVQSMRLLGELGMSFDLCLRPAELADGIRLADGCRGTRFILDHCGNADPKAFLPETAWGGERPSHEADPWRRDIRDFAKRKNVICKISGIVSRVPRGTWTAEMLAPIIKHCLDEFGPDRVVFGGDWPVCLVGASYRDWVLALKAVIHSRSEGDQRKLLHDNAVRFYGL